MSGFSSRLRAGTMLSRGLFNRSASAGPRRLLVIGGVGVLGLVTVAIIATSGHKADTPSLTARMHSINSLPGGLQSTPEQDKLALQTNQELAAKAAAAGQSYTPPINASQEINPPAPTPPLVAPPVKTAVSPQAGFHFVSAAPPPTSVTPTVHYAPPTMIHQVADIQVDPNQERMYSDAINRMLRGWDGRSPQTTVVLEARSDAAQANEEPASGIRPTSYSAADRGAAPSSAATVIMPAGRGVFAHTVLAVSSDTGGPIVLQADSGPLAGDRMIGQFSTANSNGGEPDRLVVRVNSIEHQGRTLSCDAIVTAPDTMETNVASSVDEHYLSRFLLPAAAAFVQGLGSALATTSNTVANIGPLGNTTYATSLNFPQQVGVGAGTAAAQIGSTLNREAPRGPTVHLDANANVGVMFLAPVTDTSTN